MMPGAWEVAKLILSTLLIIFFAYFLLRFALPGMRRLNRGRELAVLDRLALGPKQSLVVVLVQERILLLGVTEERVELLQELEEYPLPEESGPQGFLSWRRHNDQKRP